MSQQSPPQERPLPAFMLKTREKYPRAWAPWTEEEDALLRDLVSRGAEPSELGEALGRGPGGIAARKVTLGLEPPPPRAACGLPVPQGDWVPEWHDHMPGEQWIEETARFWGVGPDSLHSVLEDLSLDEWTVFVLRYGFARRCSYTLEAVAEFLDADGEAVLSLQKRAERAVVAGLRDLGETVAPISLDETLSRRRRPRRRR